MTLRASAFIATSLDGYIAREDGSLDWLIGATHSADDHGYTAFMATIDTLIMGRSTFEKVLIFGEWPYTAKRVVVLSSTLTRETIPQALQEAVEVHSGPIPALMDFLQGSGARSLYLDGGKVIQGFLRLGLLNEITITRIPVLIGSGIPLFGELERDIRLQHLKTTAYESGFVQSTYRVVT